MGRDELARRRVLASDFFLNLPLRQQRLQVGGSDEKGWYKLLPRPPAWEPKTREEEVELLVLVCGAIFGDMDRHYVVNNVNVTVNPVCPIGQPVSGTGENCETTSYIHQHLQNSKNSGGFERQSSTSIAETSHEGKFFQRQKFVIRVSQEYFGRSMRLCPCACQTKTLLIQRCPGSVAKYCAKFQWCLKQISDHDLDPVYEVKARTRSFQMWRISCHGNAQSILRGGPTTDRRSRRYATSILRKSLR